MGTFWTTFEEVKWTFYDCIRCLKLSILSFISLRYAEFLVRLGAVGGFLGGYFSVRDAEGRQSTAASIQHINRSYIPSSKHDLCNIPMSTVSIA